MIPQCLTRLLVWWPQQLHRTEGMGDIPGYKYSNRWIYISREKYPTYLLLKNETSTTHSGRCQLQSPYKAPSLVVVPIYSKYIHIYIIWSYIHAIPRLAILCYRSQYLFFLLARLSLAYQFYVGLSRIEMVLVIMQAINRQDIPIGQVSLE